MPQHTELWTCPKCGRRFVSRNMWHACGYYSVDGFRVQGPASYSIDSKSRSSVWPV